MSNFKAPDVKGPRFRPKWKSYLKRETFKDLESEYPEVNFKGFSEIIKCFNKNLVQGMIDSREGVELPQGLGYVFMGSCKPPKRSMIDYLASAKYGKQIRHRNLGEDGRLLKLFYTNCTSKYKFRSRQIWSLKFCKPVRKRCSIAFKENWPFYTEVDDVLKVSAYFKKKRNGN